VHGAGSDQTLHLQFAPIAPGPQRATLTITSNDPGQPSVTIALTGVGFSAPVPNIDVPTAGLDFGNVA